jgi:hypothetical protein
LRTRFIAMAIDNVENLNMTAAEKKFLSDKGLKFSTQGMSVFTAGGKVLGLGGGYEPDDVKQMLRKALEQYRPENAVDVPSRDEKDPMLRKPPEGGLVLYVTWTVLGSYDRSQSPLKLANATLEKHFQDSIGVDRLWVRKDEAAALAAGTFPQSLRERMAWHLRYTMTGCRSTRDSSNLKAFNVALSEGRLTGSVQVDKEDPGCLLGCVEAKDGKVTRFDLVIKGQGGWLEDCGFSAALRMVPKGKRVPVALLFSLADPEDDLARVPPHRAGHNGYLE